MGRGISLQQELANRMAALVRYKLNEDGTISRIDPPERNGGSRDMRLGYQASPPSVDAYEKAVSGSNVFTNIQDAQNAQARQNQKKLDQAASNLKKLQEQYESELSKERQYSALAGQISNLAGTAPLVAQQFPGGGPAPVAANAAEASALAAQIASLGGAGAQAAPTGGTRIGQDTYLTGIEKIYKDYETKIAEANKAKDTKKANDLIAERSKKIGEETTKFVQSYVASTAATPRASAQPVTGASINQALQNLSAGNLLGTSGLAARLNFQVTDQQILDDYNNLKLGRLNNIVEQGNAQIAGITQRINTANQLLAGIPANDPRRVSSQVIIDGLRKDLASVTDAVKKASDQVKNFKPITAQESAGKNEIASFREFIKLPEERALDQIFQIDPETMRTSVGLGERYRQMATAPIGPTTTQQTEALRGQIEEEALNQLRLGATLGAEERRQYEQSARAAQTARGNIFGVAPAVEEALTTGQLAEQRKLQRYGAAAQFLASGETTGAALQRDIAFRDALLQNRLGAAAGFIAGGPSLYNLSQARTGAQQAAFQNYIQANQALPGGFQSQGNQVPFYQAASPEIPVALSGQAASIYNTRQQAEASMYGSQVGAIAGSYRSPAQNFGAILSGVSGLIPSFSFSR